MPRLEETWREEMDETFPDGAEWGWRENEYVPDPRRLPMPMPEQRNAVRLAMETLWPVEGDR